MATDSPSPDGAARGRRDPADPHSNAREREARREGARVAATLNSSPVDAETSAIVARYALGLEQSDPPALSRRSPGIDSRRWVFQPAERAAN
jgi:hypothetical protein